MTGQRKAKDLTGQRFGRLVVLWRAANVAEASGAIRSAWMCKCDCGNGHVVTAHSLTRGLTRSCGCFARERPSKHGKSGAPVYRHWAAMVQRCTNREWLHYARYGGRGITVCEQWRDFAAFLADMGEPEPGMTLDRIDNAKGYEPGNCRWATRQEQSNNRGNNRYLTFRGLTLTLAEWGRITGLKNGTISQRLKSGWSTERILTDPIRRSATFKQGTD